MDEVTEASVALSWPDIGTLQWNCNHGSMTTCAMNMDSYYSFVDHQKNLAKVTMPYFPGGSVERQGLTSQDHTMQASLGHLETNNSILHHHHSEDALRAACLKQELGLENAPVGPCAKQTQINDLVHTLPQGLQEAAHGMLQSFSRGSSKLPKLDRSTSIGSSGSAKPSCRGISCNYESLVQPQSLTHRGGVFDSSLSGPGICNTKSPHQPGGTLSDVYFGKGPWIDEAQISPSERRFQLSDQVQVQQIGSPLQRSLSQPNSVAVSASGTRPRVRARRGQATDPHSIAERKRREKISNAMKELQELIPTLNKTDKMAFVEDVIEYVRFLQLQTKVFIMSRLGSTGAIAPLVAETSGEGRSGFEAAPTAMQDYATAAIEEEVAKLMEEDMSAALRFLQGKGMCLMPISLAAAIPSKDAKQPD